MRRRIKETKLKWIEQLGKRETERNEREIMFCVWSNFQIKLKEFITRAL